MRNAWIILNASVNVKRFSIMLTTNATDQTNMFSIEACIALISYIAENESTGVIHNIGTFFLNNHTGLTYIDGSEFLVGPGLQQQARTVRQSSIDGVHERRVFVLCLNEKDIISNKNGISNERNLTYSFENTFSS